MSDGGLGHAASKILRNPNLCDQVCLDTAIWLAVVLGIMSAVFPTDEEGKQNGSRFDPSIESMLTGVLQSMKESASTQYGVH
jgi:hypothetical protein